MCVTEQSVDLLGSIASQKALVWTVAGGRVFKEIYHPEIRDDASLEYNKTGGHIACGAQTAKKNHRNHLAVT